MIRLQELSPDDWKLWRELRLAALTEAPYAFNSNIADWEAAPEQRWRQRLSTPATYHVAAILGDTPVGVAAGFPTDEANVAKLMSIWVAPSARGRGVADELITAVGDWARTTGASILELHVLVGNGSAHELYLRNGFVDFHEADDTRPNDSKPEVVMRKQL